MQPIDKDRPVMKSILQGITRLTEGQLQFSQEFGLTHERVLPELAELFESKDIELTLNGWLFDEKRGEHYFSLLLNALIDHQLALISGLDGVCVQALNTINGKHAEKESLMTRLTRTLAKEKEQAQTLHDLKHNSQLRYQKVLAPGFINAYMKSRER